MAALREWYGLDGGWVYPFQREARRQLGDEIVIDVTPDRLAYSLPQLAVPGDPVVHAVAIELHREPTYETYGTPPQDCPRVRSSPDLRSKHRFPDDPLRLCLWYPGDPPERRWTSAWGLLALIEVVRLHLFLENHWRRTGVWLLEDAPHGLGNGK